MRYVKPLIGSAILIGLMFAASFWALTKLGNQLIATHFGPTGHPDGFHPASEGVFVVPAAALVLCAILGGLSLLPPRDRLERSWGPYVAVWLGLMLFFLALHLGLLAFALGYPVEMGRVTTIGGGLVIAVLGNLLGKVRYNRVFGVRTPWTLADERVWDRTHRFGGWVMTFGGLAAVTVGVLAPSAMTPQLHLVWIVCIGVPALAAVIYSYVESRLIDRPR